MLVDFYGQVPVLAPNRGQCPLLAQSGHPDALNQCPLLGVKRTSSGLDPMSAYDPKRTLSALWRGNYFAARLFSRGTGDSGTGCGDHIGQATVTAAHHCARRRLCDCTREPDREFRRRAGCGRSHQSTGWRYLPRQWRGAAGTRSRRKQRQNLRRFVLYWLPDHSGRGTATGSDARRAALTEPTACASHALCPSRRHRF